jgi:hypothetical protein
MSVVCFTSLTLAELPQARVLAETLRAAHPDWSLWALLVDRPPGAYANRAAFAGFSRVVLVENLPIPNLLPWLFAQERDSARGAARGAMFSHLLGLGADTVAWFAPGTAVFHPLASLPTRREPVLVAPGDAEGAGFLAVRNNDAGRSFAAAWAARLAADPAAKLGIRPTVVRDPGWGVTDRALARHTLRFAPSGDIRVDGAPLAFYRFDAAPTTAAGAELAGWHARRVAELAEPGIAADWWHFARFSDGTPIPDTARRFARAKPEAVAAFADPFDAAEGGFRDWLAANAPEAL